MNKMLKVLNAAKDDILKFIYPGERISPRRSRGGAGANGMIRDFFSPSGPPPAGNRISKKDWERAAQRIDERAAITKKKMRG